MNHTFNLRSGEAHGRRLHKMQFVAGMAVALSGAMVLLADLIRAFSH